MSSKKKRRKEAWLLREKKRALEKEAERKYQEAMGSGDIEKMAALWGIKLN